MEASDICRGELEIEVPWDEVAKESDKVLKAYRQQVRIPGFRPGKAPDSVIKMRFQKELEAEVIEKLVDRHFWKAAQEQDYQVIGTPQVRDLKFEDKQPLKFKAEFEIIPDFELKDYKRLEVPYQEPEVSDEEVQEELDRLREQHASFRNLDPRPLEDKDIAVISLKSGEVEGAPKIDQEETTLLIGGEETLEDFSNALRGKSPGDEVDFEVSYPEDFGNPELAGKSIPFHAEVKGLRVRELPELDDDFATDVGDFQTLDELKSRIREEIMTAKRRRSVEDAKDHLVDQLVSKHEFPVPQRLVDQQIRSRLERLARTFAQQGVDLENAGIDWSRMAEEQRPRALRDVRAGLLLERIAEVEAVEAEQEQIDAQVEHFARQQQMTLAAARKQLAEDGTLERIESHLINEKVTSLLFDEAVKVDPPPPSEEESEAAGDAPAEEPKKVESAEPAPVEEAAEDQSASSS